jgi:hypothetical protein
MSMVIKFFLKQSTSASKKDQLTHELQLRLGRVGPFEALKAVGDFALA